MGDWELRCEYSGITAAVDQLVVNPSATSQVKFDNPSRKLTAGTPFGYTDGRPHWDIKNFEVELQDGEQTRHIQPRPDCPLTEQRAMMFQLIHMDFQINKMADSQGSQPTGGFKTYITSLQFRLIVYATFYYLDTCVTELQGADKPKLTATPNWTISSAQQSVHKT